MKKTWKIPNYSLVDPVFRKGGFKKKSQDKSSLGLLDRTPSFFLGLSLPGAHPRPLHLSPSFPPFHF